MKYDRELADLILSRPFAVHGSPIPDDLQDEIARRMAESVPEFLRPQVREFGLAGTQALARQRAEERAEIAPEVERMFAENMPVRQVARALGKSDMYIRRVAKEHDIPIPVYTLEMKREASRRGSARRKARMAGGYA